MIKYYDLQRNSIAERKTERNAHWGAICNDDLKGNSFLLRAFRIEAVSFPQSRGFAKRKEREATHVNP